ncbi:MAG: hypothetical protein IK016_07195 [Lachnospiraceae bacterium]|nr:hypothetical protein [Lachnospiraceae bacterium]
MDNPKDNHGKKVIKYLVGIFFATFLSVCLTPLSQKVVILLHGAGSSFFRGISDYYYRTIASGDVFVAFVSTQYVFFALFGAGIGAAIANQFVQLSTSRHRWLTISQKISSIRKTGDESTPKCDSFINQEPSAIASFQKLAEIEEHLNEVSNLLDEELSTIEKSERKQYQTSRIVHSVICALLIAAFLVVMMIHGFFSTAYKTIVRTANNIEIVSPYISDIEYRQLKSDYHSICNADDYDELISHLRAIADKNGLNLRE